MDFNTLKQQYSSCCRCPALCRSRSQVVFGSGNQDAKVLFIGEAPGANEDKQGIPFCGMSGQILSELLSSIGLSREDIFITNTILCRPENNRNPAKEEVENCRERLDQLISIMQPKVIVTIGNFATERILGKTGIKSIRGQKFEYQIRQSDGQSHGQSHGQNHGQNHGQGIEVKVVPVIHPASYLYSGRNPEMLKQMKSDFQTIKEVIEIRKAQKSLEEF